MNQKSISPLATFACQVEGFSKPRVTKINAIPLSAHPTTYLPKPGTLD